MLRNVKVENIMRGSQIAIPLPLIGSKKGCTKNVTPLEAVRSAQGCRPVRHPWMLRNVKVLAGDPEQERRSY